MGKPTRAYRKVPQEIWDTITSHLPSVSAWNAAKSFKFSAEPYDRVWSSIFKTEEWLQSNGAESSNIVLFGADLDLLGTHGKKKSPRQLHIVLTAFDPAGDLRYEHESFRKSFRVQYGGTEKDYKLDCLNLTVGSFDASEILGTDFRYLFSSQGQKLQTKYCFWNDPEKKIRTLKTEQILGIDGPITKPDKLAPIFLLSIQPPNQNFSQMFREYNYKPQQFIFRAFGGWSFWSGMPPLVGTIKDRKFDGLYPWSGFEFNDTKHYSYPRQGTDWVTEAEKETGEDCKRIRA
jgi:hypothetical protein